MTNSQTLTYASVAKNALVIKTADRESITEKRVKSAKALANVPIGKAREATNGALIMTFKSKVNME